MIKIKSITDIITNSSNEVYSYFSEDSVKLIYDMFDNLFESFNILDDPRNIFKIELELNSILVNIYKSVKNTTEVIPKAVDNWKMTSDYIDYPLYSSVTISTKVKKFESMAESVNKVVNGLFFDTMIFYSDKIDGVF